KDLLHQLQEDSHEVVQLTASQIGSFAGNMLAVRNKRGEQLMVMSKAAFDCLTPAQITTIERYARILYSDVHVIESVGGGSVRCMIAENFLPHM
ncbi:MAG TPA: arginine deiminase-related protein, partial [Saprospiraceae bacterium]|nr:arginine deiminase-related protein [Saprospiraceae bacterium]